MIYTRKKLLLWEDEAEMIEFALEKVAEGFEEVEKEYGAMQALAFSADDEAKYAAFERGAKRVAAKTRRILKLVQDAEVTETVVEL